MLFRRLKKAAKGEVAEFAGRCRDQGAGLLDGFAMVLAAFLVILLPCLGVLLTLGGLILWVFG